MCWVSLFWQIGNEREIRQIITSKKLYYFKLCGYFPITLSSPNCASFSDPRYPSNLFCMLGTVTSCAHQMVQPVLYTIDQQHQSMKQVVSALNKGVKTQGWLWTKHPHLERFPYFPFAIYHLKMGWVDVLLIYLDVGWYWVYVCVAVSWVCLHMR